MDNKIKAMRQLMLSLFLMLILFSCGDEKKNKSPEFERGKQQDETVPVKIVYARRGDIRQILKFSSRLESEFVVEVYSKSTGILEKREVSKGDKVKVNQLLAQLQKREEELALKAAEIDFEKAKKDYEDKMALFNQGLIAQNEINEYKYKKEKAEVELEIAKKNLDNKTILSPISGVVTECFAEKGELVQANSKLFTIIDSENIIAKIKIPEKDFYKSRFEVNPYKLEAFITSDVIKKEVPCTVYKIDPVVDPKSGTIEVTMKIENVSEFKDLLLPGLYVEVKIILQTLKNVLLIPRKTLIYDEDTVFVFVVKDNVARKTFIQTGISEGDLIEVKSGISDNEQVVIVGQHGLKDNTRVRVSE